MRSNACPGRVGNKNIDMDVYFFLTTSRMENKNIDMDVKISVIFSHHQPDGKQKKDIQEFFRPPPKVASRLRNGNANRTAGEGITAAQR